MRAVSLAAALWLCAAVAGADTFDVPATAAVPVPGTALSAILVAVTDHRCPSDLDCYWEGEKRVTLSVEADGVTETIVLCNSCEGATRTAVAFGTLFRFDDLLPPVEEIEALGDRASLMDYAARVTVGE